MTVSNNVQANFARVNVQSSMLQSNNTQQASVAADTAVFSDAAKQMAKVHSQSGASGAWTHSSMSNTASTAQSSSSFTSTSNNLQSMLMKTILSAYGASSHQNGANTMNFTA